MYKKLLFFFLCLSPFWAFAQTGGVKGKIVEDGTDEPMIGVTVLVEGTSKGGVTDLDGNFELKGIAAGKQKLRISYIGYETLNPEVEI